MLVCAMIQQHISFGEGAFKQVISPIGFLAWGSSFCLALMFWYFILDFAVRISKIKKISN